MADIDIENCHLMCYPAEILAKTAQPIDQIDENVRQLVEKMKDIMRRNNGCGLAGPQANASLRIFIVSLDPNKEDIRVYINPTVTPVGELVTHEEGCLSVPGIYTKIKRYKECKITATDLDGNEFTDQAEGLYARVLQHEIDHLNGTIVVDRMGSAAKIAHRKQLKKFVKGYEQ